MDQGQEVVTGVSPRTEDERQEVVLKRFPVRIVRNADATIRVEDPLVSRHHCLVDCLDAVLVVCDLGSRHGTWVNGERVVESRLQVGDQLTLGRSTFQVGWKDGEFTFQEFRESGKVGDRAAASGVERLSLDLDGSL